MLLNLLFPPLSSSFCTVIIAGWGMKEFWPRAGLRALVTTWGGWGEFLQHSGEKSEKFTSAWRCVWDLLSDLCVLVAKILLILLIFFFIAFFFSFNKFSVCPFCIHETSHCSYQTLCLSVTCWPDPVSAVSSCLEAGKDLFPPTS